MANVKISALPAATTVASTDLLPVVQGGATKQTTPDLLPLSAAAVTALAGKAGLVSPAFTGAPTIGGTAVAKTSDITAAVNALIGGASTAYDTLGELATQLASDENAAAALTTLVGQKSLSLPVNVITPAGASVRNAVIGARNSVDASTGPVTVALPTPTAVGQHLILERADASAVTANAITVTGTIRNAPSNVVLNAVGAAFEGALYIAESLTSWAIAGSIKPRAVLDAAYDAKGAATAAVAAQAVTDAATYTTKTKLRAASLLTRFAPADTNPIPPVSTDLPTLTIGTAATVTARVIGPQSGQVTEVGSRGTWNSTSGRLDNLGPGVTGLDFYLTGTTVEVQFLANSAGAQPMWLFIDGKPMTATPDTTSIGTVASGTTYFLKLAFGTSARRRIELFIAPIAAWYAVRTDNATLVTPAPRKPVVGFVGDSFWAGSNGTPLMQSGAFILARTLGVECFSQSYGGTGYVNAGSFTTYGATARTSQMTAAGAELVILSGSVNDDPSNATVAAAAAAAFAAYGTAVPNARLIVFGPQPSNAVDTISAARAASIAAVAAAAAAAPNVLAFHDQVGTLTGVPGAINGGTTYPDGSLVTYKGSVFKLANGGATNSTANPATNLKWSLLTYAYLGTGTSGTPASDGTRDAYLYSDGVHPLPAGNAAFALQQAGIIRADLLTAAA